MYMSNNGIDSLWYNQGLSKAEQKFCSAKIWESNQPLLLWAAALTRILWFAMWKQNKTKHQYTLNNKKKIVGSHNWGVLSWSSVKY